ncbi:hypothetical protein C7B65_13495 [Phormidesmis priestleyi ULC007]|uniref:Uncharacterized protein n=1 Tax=Phormidesmis priestleyi ULC007 TaxID=1920490 RepID=A0A2T1DEZ5_9CYAN|nr:hypothetical protein [Phormidesmis priestleyi]PSB19024.1 hypothetical protein C7B65_13495 [Phormidesmis priestleyi ULC007]PZO54012.1 MAG: hypothetical protein DCF14_03550 [Phormidesmis priestleyi]
MSTWTTYRNREITQEEQRLYNHFLDRVPYESPRQLIDRFRSLFIEGTSYDPHVMADLDKVVASKVADQEFKFVLNRCCHILINRWQARPQAQRAIVELVALLSSLPTRPVMEHSRTRTVKQLRELVRQFLETEQYLTLRRLSQLMIQGAETHSAETSQLGTLIRRYPYLYEHCLVSEGSPDEHQESIRQIQTQVQRQYEIDLSQYVTYQVRRSFELRETPLASPLIASAQVPTRLITPVKNPTLLDDRDLRFALQQFAGKIEGAYTHRDIAQRFLNHASDTKSFKAFKDDLYQYITASIDSEYGKRQFNKQLYAHLQATLPESDFQPLNDFLIVRTCSQLLNFLVVESPQQPQHFVFVDLLSNLGPTLTTSLLLKIVLLCRKVKPYLEKRFSILFSHYESHTRNCVDWLIAAMENLHVALSINFSTLNLCFVNQLV